MTIRSTLAFLALFWGACAVLQPATAQADDTKGSTELNLRSRYLDKPILARGRVVHFVIELDGKGGGKGTVSLDPNKQWGRSSTKLANRTRNVTLKLVKDLSAENKGRNLYEINMENVTKRRVLLMIPTAEGSSCWLVISGDEGLEDIIELQRQK